MRGLPDNQSQVSKVVLGSASQQQRVGDYVKGNSYYSLIECMDAVCPSYVVFELTYWCNWPVAIALQYLAVACLISPGLIFMSKEADF